MDGSFLLVNSWEITTKYTRQSWSLKLVYSGLQEFLLNGFSKVRVTVVKIDKQSEMTVALRKSADNSQTVKDLYMLSDRSMISNINYI
jgi:hypothetical protein